MLGLRTVSHPTPRRAWPLGRREKGFLCHLWVSSHEASGDQGCGKWFVIMEVWVLTISEKYVSTPGIFLFIIYPKRSLIFSLHWLPQALLPSTSLLLSHVGSQWVTRFSLVHDGKDDGRSPLWQPELIALGWAPSSSSVFSSPNSWEARERAGDVASYRSEPKATSSPSLPSAFAFFFLSGLVFWHILSSEPSSWTLSVFTMPHYC